MIKVFVTGADGFIGSHLTEILLAQGYNVKALSYYNSFNNWGWLEGMKHPQLDVVSGDVRDSHFCIDVTKDVDIIFHLAALIAIPYSYIAPDSYIDTNVKGTLNILESLKNLNRPCRIIYISSADVYGRQSKDSYPLLETIIPNPINPYSASKLAAEIYCRQYASVSKFLDIMVARPFNHIGVGQRKEFVIPNFCQQIIESSKSSNPEIKVGDISSTRDFLDVRDVVKAYVTLAKKGVSGELYNICSGEETSIESVLNIIIQQSGKNIKITKDPSRFREAETPRLFGNNDKLKALGWQKKYKLSESLKEIYQNLLETN